MDIGAILKAPMEDKDWIKKCLIMGLFSIIPIAGMLNLMGWGKGVYLARSQGSTELPEAGLNYMGEGWGVLLTMLPFLGVVIFCYIGIGVAAALDVGVLALPFSLILMVSMLALMVALPAMYYRHYVHNDKFAALSIKPVMNLITSHMGTYVLLWVVVSIISGFIAQLGMLACGVGMLVTMPLATAINGVAIADFAKEVNNA